MAKAARKLKVEVAQPEVEAAPLRLDIGCGKNPREGFEGVDAIDFGQKHVIDVRGGIPFPDNSVDEIHTSHFLEHLTGPERVAFMNEVYRVLKPGKQITVITPAWSHDCAYGDPTHQWPPVSRWTPLYWNKAWRDANAPHTGYTCDFDWTSAGSWDQALEGRNQEYVQMAMQTQVNALRDMIFVATKRAE